MPQSEHSPPTLSILCRSNTLGCNAQNTISGFSYICETVIRGLAVHCSSTFMWDSEFNSSTAGSSESPRNCPNVGLYFGQAWCNREMREQMMKWMQQSHPNTRSKKTLHNTSLLIRPNIAESPHCWGIPIYTHWQIWFTESRVMYTIQQKHTVLIQRCHRWWQKKDCMLHAGHYAHRIPTVDSCPML